MISNPPITTAKEISTEKPVRSPLLHDDMHDHPQGTQRPTHRPGRVSRTMVNFWIDLGLGVSFVGLCITAIVVQFVFPPGIAARGWTLWGMSFGQWSSVQFTLLAVMALGVLVHVMLHWTWVCSVFAKRVLSRPSLPDDGIRTVYGVGILISILLLGAVTIGMAQWMIVAP